MHRNNGHLTARVSVGEDVWTVSYQIWNDEGDFVRPSDVTIEDIKDGDGKEVVLSQKEIDNMELCRKCLETW